MTKGTLKVVEGDVTNPQRTAPNETVIIVHCCNNLGVMGAGVALALRKKWGKVYNVYQDMFHKYINRNTILLGDVSSTIVEFEPNETIGRTYVMNMIGQDGTVSKDNPKPVKYTALAKAMSRVFTICDSIALGNPDRKVVIHAPKFGSDLAGGNWDFILELIREIWIEQGIDVVVYEFPAK